MPSGGFTRAAWERFLSEGRLMGVRCRSCGALSAVPRAPCGGCREGDLEWVEFSGRGTVEGFTVVHVPPTPLCAAGFGRENPYGAAVIRLAEGPAITARLLGFDPRQPEGVRVGASVRAAFLGEGGRTVLAFRLEG